VILRFACNVNAHRFALCLPTWRKTLVRQHKAAQLTEAGQSGTKTRHQFVTKTRPFWPLSVQCENGKATQAKGFSFCTSGLTRYAFIRTDRIGKPKIGMVEEIEKL
jgi:hypothetical protein